MTSSDGFVVEVAALRRYASDVDSFGDQAGRFRQLVSEADVADDSWGVVGWATKGMYTTALGQLRDYLASMQQGLNTSADRLRLAADGYALTDQQTQQRLDAIAGRLDDGRHR